MKEQEGGGTSSKKERVLFDATFRPWIDYVNVKIATRNHGKTSDQLQFLY